jgi:hypothetical protein
MNDLCVSDKFRWEVEFIQYIALPLFMVVTRMFPELQSNLDLLNENCEKWKVKMYENSVAKA